MALTAPKTMPVPGGGGQQYEPIPADNYPAICCGVIDLGTHQDSYQGQDPKWRRHVKVQFEIPDVRRGDGKTAIVSKTFYNLSYHEKAGFRIALDSWLGSGWEDTYGGQDLSFLIGLPAMVNVTLETADDGKKYNKISAITKLPSRMGKIEGERDSFYLDLESLYLPPELSKYDAEKIRGSAEYKANTFRDEAPRNDGGGAYVPRTTTPPAPALPTRTGSPVDVNDPGDGCPF